MGYWEAGIRWCEGGISSADSQSLNDAIESSTDKTISNTFVDLLLIPTVPIWEAICSAMRWCDSAELYPWPITVEPRPCRTHSNFRRPRNVEQRIVADE